MAKFYIETVREAFQNQWKSGLDIPGPIPYGNLKDSPLKINRKFVWDFHMKFLRSASQNQRELLLNFHMESLRSSFQINGKFHMESLRDPSQNQ